MNEQTDGQMDEWTDGLTSYFSAVLKTLVSYRETVEDDTLPYPWLPVYIDIIFISYYLSNARLIKVFLQKIFKIVKSIQIQTI